MPDVFTRDAVGSRLVATKVAFQQWSRASAGFAVRWLVPSLLLHAVAGVSLAALPLPASAVSAVSMEVSFDAMTIPAPTAAAAVVTPPPPVEDAVVPPSEPSAPAPPVPSRRRARQTTSAPEQPAVVEQVPAPEVPAPTNDSQASDAPATKSTEAPRRSADDLARLLQPQAVARSTVEWSLGDQSPAAPQTTGTSRRAPSPPTRGEVEARVNSFIKEGARNTAHSSAPDPELRARADGSYTYSGPSFSAVIDSDGRVHFNDKDGAWSPTNPLGGSFDLNSIAERAAGNDPHRSERRWFMERTSALRERLERTRKVRLASMPAEQMQSYLARVFSNPRLDANRRKQEVLRLWDALGEAAEPAAARAELLAFLRVRCPPASACAFNREELRSFNEGRPARDQFAP